MARCRADSSITRVKMHGFSFPLGVYPIEDLTPREGYTVAFEPADGSDGSPPPAGRGSSAGAADDDDEPAAGELDEFGAIADEERAEWEEWPDRYVFDILVSAQRVEPLCRALLALLPGRVYPILDVLGHDEFREVDPYVSYELIGQDRVLDALRRYRAFFYEDGLVGFGAMSDEPFLYVFVDEHKIVTVRAETQLREKIESVLAAFDLTEIEELKGADAATHEHRGVLEAPEDRLDLLTAEEIVEELRDEWRLVLNVDPERNVDDEGNELGMVGWRCVVRFEPILGAEGSSVVAPGIPELGEGENEAGSASAKLEDATAEGQPADSPEEVPVFGPARYAEVLLTAPNLATAESLAEEAVWSLIEKEAQAVPGAEAETLVIVADRLLSEHYREALKAVSKQTPDFSDSGIVHVAWLT